MIFRVPMILITIVKLLTVIYFNRRLETKYQINLVDIMFKPIRWSKIMFQKCTAFFFFLRSPIAIIVFRLSDCVLSLENNTQQYCVLKFNTWRHKKYTSIINILIPNYFPRSCTVVESISYYNIIHECCISVSAIFLKNNEYFR